MFEKMTRAEKAATVNSQPESTVNSTSQQHNRPVNKSQTWSIITVPVWYDTNVQDLGEFEDDDWNQIVQHRTSSREEFPPRTTMKLVRRAMLVVHRRPRSDDP